MQVIVSVLEAANGNKCMIQILRLIDRIHVGNAAAYIGMGTEYILKDVLYLTIPALTDLLGFTGLGLLKFNRKDLK